MISLFFWYWYFPRHANGHFGRGARDKQEGVKRLDLASTEQTTIGAVAKAAKGRVVGAWCGA